MKACINSAKYSKVCCQTYFVFVLKVNLYKKCSYLCGRKKQLNMLRIDTYIKPDFNHVELFSDQIQLSFQTPIGRLPFITRERERERERERCYLASNNKSSRAKYTNNKSNKQHFPVILFCRTSDKKEQIPGFNDSGRIQRYNDSFHADFCGFRRRSERLNDFRFSLFNTQRSREGYACCNPPFL
jgi:hypothetical protein